MLPALLSLLGDRIERGRLPLLGRRRSSSGSWGPWSDRVLRRPLVSVLVSAGLLVVLAVPAFVLHTNNAGETALPQGLKITNTYYRIERAFPGGGHPAYVVSSPRCRRGAGTAGRRRARPAGTGVRRAKEPGHRDASEDRRVAVVSIGLVGSGTDRHSEQALELLRTRLVPGTLERFPV